MPATPTSYKPIDRVAHKLDGDRGFFGHRQVGGSRARDQHGAVSARNVSLRQRDGACFRVIRRVGHDGTHGVVRVRLGPRHQQRLTAPDDALGDGGDLGRSLAYAQDDFGESLPERAVRIDAGKAEVLERRHAKRAEDARRTRRPARSLRDRTRSSNCSSSEMVIRGRLSLVLVTTRQYNHDGVQRVFPDRATRRRRSPSDVDYPDEMTHRTLSGRLSPSRFAHDPCRDAHARHVLLRPRHSRRLRVAPVLPGLPVHEEQGSAAGSCSARSRSCRPSRFSFRSTTRCTWRTV